MEWIVSKTDFCLVGIRYENTYPIVIIRSNAMTRKRMETPFELLREQLLKIPPNRSAERSRRSLPLAKGGDKIRLFLEGDEEG